MASLGEFLREQRDAKNMSQRDLAAASGLGQSYISMLERNGRQPSWDATRKLAKALGVDHGQFLMATGLLQAAPTSLVEASGRPDSELLQLARVWGALPETQRLFLLRLANSLVDVDGETENPPVAVAHQVG